MVSAADITSGKFTFVPTTNDLNSGSFQFKVTDSDGGTTSANAATMNIDIATAGLTATGVDVSAIEGNAVTATVATFTDANPLATTADFTATITWGDGTTSDGTITEKSGVFSVTGTHTYAEEGSDPIGVTIKDAGGGAAGTNSTATVADAALTGSAAASVTATEGATATLTNATFTDANPGNHSADFSGTINWGDGTTSTFDSSAVSYNSGTGTYTVAGSHTYAEEGTDTVTVTVNDDGLKTTTITGTATVADAALTGSAAASVTATEGATATLTNATFTDANPGDHSADFSGTINWGDGTTSTFDSSAVSYNSGTGTYTVAGSHTYAEEGTDTVTVTVNDDGLKTTTITGTATVADAALTGSAAASVTATEGATATLTNATFTDANPGDHSADFSGTINWGDGTTSTFDSSAVSYNSGTGTYTVAGSHTYAEEGTDTVTVTVNDDGLKTTTITGTATVADAALTGSAAASVTATEGATATLTNATFTDANPGDHSADFSGTINWGDGTTSTFDSSAVSYNSGTGTYTVAGSHTYAEEGTDTVTVTVNDDGLKTTTITGTATVADAALTGSAAASVTATEGATATLTNATFTDANPGDHSADFSGTINWGDGTTSTFDSSAVSYNSNGTYTVAGSHTYAEEGTDNVTVTVNDDGLKTTTITGTATVADAALTGSAAASVTATEGATATLTNATFTDANPGDHSADFSGTINWGDGTTSTFDSSAVSYNSNGTYTVAGSHTYAEEGTDNVTVTVNDDGLKTTTITGTATVADAALTGSAAASVTATEGATATLTNATFTDANPGDHSADFSGTINWGDGTTSTFDSSAVSYNSNGTYTVAGSHTYAEEGTDNVTVTVNDDGLKTTTITGTATVADAALTGSAAASVTATEGATATLTNATFTDANPGDHSADFSGTINWGDGTTSTFDSSAVSYNRHWHLYGCRQPHLCGRGHRHRHRDGQRRRPQDHDHHRHGDGGGRGADRERDAGQRHRGQCGHGDGGDVHGRQPASDDRRLHGDDHLGRRHDLGRDDRREERRVLGHRHPHLCGGRLGPDRRDDQGRRRQHGEHDQHGDGCPGCGETSSGRRDIGVSAYGRPDHAGGYRHCVRQR